MRLLSLFAVAAALTLSACATTGGSSSAPAASSSGQVASPTQTQQFMTAIEAKRGSALTFAERVQLQGLTGAAKVGINNTQTSFLNKVGAQVGLDGAMVAAIFPEAGKPVSESVAVQRLEKQLGKPLTVANANAVKAATTLRNNSVVSLKTGLANSIGSRVGMDGQVILALMPLLGF
jgi:protein-disulfide isomerase-like protein with CxxC motif